SSRARRKASIDDKIIANTLRSRLAQQATRALPSGAWLETFVAKSQPRRAFHAGGTRGRSARARDARAGDSCRRKRRMRKGPIIGSAAATGCDERNNRQP